MKMPIVSEFLLSRTIETDRIWAFSKDQKTDGTKSMHICYEGTAPEYLQELISRHIPARSLRSSSQARLRIPSATEKHTIKQFGIRTFCNSAPKFWNTLPQTIREADSSATFRRRLKTHLFSDFLFQYLLDSLCTVTFLSLPNTFFSVSI